MLSREVNIYQVSVEFDARDGKITLGNDLRGGMLSIPQGVHLIHFTLETKNAPSDVEKASFPSYPIQWLDAAMSTAAPPQSFLGQFFAPYQFSLTVFNAAGFKAPHNFSLMVVYRGKVYGSDPTIINEPPGPDGPPDDPPDHGGGAGG